VSFARGQGPRAEVESMGIYIGLKNRPQNWLVVTGTMEF